MQIKMIAPSSSLWNKVEEYAGSCSWSAGKALSDQIKKHLFSDWERVAVCFEGENICGYCTVSKRDCIPDVPYTPYISFVFVGEQYRGNRISERMIAFAASYLKSVGFKRVYLISDHENLYEKYGFTVIDRKIAPRGKLEKIYMKNL